MQLRLQITREFSQRVVSRRNCVMLTRRKRPRASRRTHKSKNKKKKSKHFHLVCFPFTSRPRPHPLPLLISGPETPAFRASHLLLFQSYRSCFPIFTSITSPRHLICHQPPPPPSPRSNLPPVRPDILKYSGLIETPFKRERMKVLVTPPTPLLLRRACVGARDPYCGWDLLLKKCTTLEESVRMSQWEQSITKCPVSSRLREFLELHHPHGKHNNSQSASALQLCF